MNRKIASLALVPLAAMSFAACGSSGSSNSSSSSAPVVQTPTDKFLSYMRSQGVSPSVPDTALISLANGACQDFEQGSSYAGVLVDGANVYATGNSGMTLDQIGSLIGAGVATFCPQYGPEIQGSATPTTTNS